MDLFVLVRRAIWFLMIIGCDIYFMITGKSPLQMEWIWGLRGYHIMLFIGIFELMWSLIINVIRYSRCRHLSLPDIKPPRYTKAILVCLVVWVAYLAALRVVDRFFISDVWFFLTLTAFLLLLERFFIHVWCPFGNYIAKVPCCARCRFRCWGEAMIFSTLLMGGWNWGIALFSFGLFILILDEIMRGIRPSWFTVEANCGNICMKCTLRKHVGHSMADNR